MKKRFCFASMFLIAMIVAMIPAAAATADYPDVPENHWAYKEIMQLTEMGVFTGYADGSFGPDDSLSYAEFFALVTRVADPNDVAVEQAKAASNPDKYDWCEPYVRVVSKNQLYPFPYSFEFNDAITRYEIASVLNQADIKLNVNPPAAEDTAKIAGYADIPEKYQSAVAQVYAKGLMKGLSDGRFHGENTVTRAEAAAVVARLSAARTSPLAGLIPENINLPYANGRDRSNPNLRAVVVKDIDTGETVGGLEIDTAPLSSSSRTDLYTPNFWYQYKQADSHAKNQGVGIGITNPDGAICLNTTVVTGNTALDWDSRDLAKGIDEPGIDFSDIKIQFSIPMRPSRTTVEEELFPADNGNYYAFVADAEDFIRCPDLADEAHATRSYSEAFSISEIRSHIEDPFVLWVKKIPEPTITWQAKGTVLAYDSSHDKEISPIGLTAELWIYQNYQPGDQTRHYTKVAETKIVNADGSFSLELTTKYTDFKAVRLEGAYVKIGGTTQGGVAVEETKKDFDVQEYNWKDASRNHHFALRSIFVDTEK